MNSLIKILQKKAEATKKLEEMYKRADKSEGFLKRYVFGEYKFVQKRRWIKENVTPDTTGGKWQELKPYYASYKKRKFASYPGSGSKKLIATYTLFPSVLGESKDSRVIIQNKKLGVFTRVQYADEVNKVRPFDTFSNQFRKRILRSYSKYISGKKVNERR